MMHQSKQIMPSGMCIFCTHQFWSKSLLYYFNYTHISNVDGCDGGQTFVYLFIYFWPL